MKFLIPCLLLSVLCHSAAVAQNKTRDEKVRDDRERVTSDGFWIYNDLPKAFAEAKKTGKPILAGLRCIPCEECVKLDDHLVDTDPVIRPLLEQFVCVRIVSTNGLDLSLLQFDTDQSFAMFMLNADRTIYGRFGTRSHRTEWFGDVSLPGLAKALQGALDLHRNYATVRDSLAGKTGAPLEFPSPEKYPTLSERFTDHLNNDGEVAKSCIHCHQIGDARRDFYRSQGEAIPAKLLFPYPHPKSLGLILDPNELATVKDVVEDSPAQNAGFQAGDQIKSLNGQPLLSIADVQWVLNDLDPAGATLSAVVVRGENGAIRVIRWTLPDGWRQRDDVAWRASTWGLRRMVTGGLRLETLSDKERQRLKIADDSMALLVQHVGQYGKHALAKKAGFQKNDVIVSFGGRTDLMTDSELLTWGAANTKPGQKLTVSILRDGRTLQKQLMTQD